MRFEPRSRKSPSRPTSRPSRNASGSFGGCSSFSRCTATFTPDWSFLESWRKTRPRGPTDARLTPGRGPRESLRYQRSDARGRVGVHRDPPRLLRPHPRCRGVDRRDGVRASTSRSGARCRTIARVDRRPARRLRRIRPPRWIGPHPFLVEGRLYGHAIPAADGAPQIVD